MGKKGSDRDGGGGGDGSFGMWWNARTGVGRALVLAGSARHSEPDLVDNAPGIDNGECAVAEPVELDHLGLPVQFDTPVRWSFLGENGIDGDGGGEGDRDGDGIGDGIGDLNDRGRGRTLETQMGGVAVVRAWWEFHRAVDRPSSSSSPFSFSFPNES